MPTRIDLPKDIVKQAFNMKLNSLKRAHKEATNPLIKTALDDELSQIASALNTITDIK